MDPRIDAEHAAKMIRSINTLDELAGYEAQAKSRGIAGHEVTLIAEKRRELTGIYRRQG